MYYMFKRKSFDEYYSLSLNYPIYLCTFRVYKMCEIIIYLTRFLSKVYSVFVSETHQPIFILINEFKLKDYIAMTK